MASAPIFGSASTGAARSRGLVRWLGRSRPHITSVSATDMELIAHDSPIDIDHRTQQVVMLVDKVFGEMGCRNNTPRSVTMMVHRDWNMLAVPRNILKTMPNDTANKQLMQETYRKGVMESHLHRRSFLKHLHLNHLHYDQFTRVRNHSNSSRSIPRL